jgi:Cys-rich four helix bundle protein (predicted Tat secretion target)
MNRREILLGGVALASAAIVSNAQAAEKEHAHEHHHHGAAANSGLLNAAADCIQKGEVCVNHCLYLLGQGEKEMAACAKSVHQVIAICGALQQLANLESSYLPRLAAVAMDICKKCEDECKKHADKHEECKACGESCAACYKECKKIAA